MKDMSDALKNIKDKIEELNKTRVGTCWVCDEKVQNWIVLLPDQYDGLGFGSTGDKTRIAFVPICSEHDISDPDIIHIIRERLEIKKMEMQ